MAVGARGLGRAVLFVALAASGCALFAPTQYRPHAEGRVSRDWPGCDGEEESSGRLRAFKADCRVVAERGLFEAEGAALEYFEKELEGKGYTHFHPELGLLVERAPGHFIGQYERWSLDYVSVRLVDREAFERVHGPLQPVGALLQALWQGQLDGKPLELALTVLSKTRHPLADPAPVRALAADLRARAPALEADIGGADRLRGLVSLLRLAQLTAVLKALERNLGPDLPLVDELIASLEARGRDRGGPANRAFWWPGPVDAIPRLRRDLAEAEQLERLSQAELLEVYAAKLPSFPCGRREGDADRGDGFALGLLEQDQAVRKPQLAAWLEAEAPRERDRGHPARASLMERLATALRDEAHCRGLEEALARSRKRGPDWHFVPWPTELWVSPEFLALFQHTWMKPEDAHFMWENWPQKLVEFSAAPYANQAVKVSLRNFEAGHGETLRTAARTGYLQSDYTDVRTGKYVEVPGKVPEALQSELQKVSAELEGLGGPIDSARERARVVRASESSVTHLQCDPGTGRNCKAARQGGEESGSSYVARTSAEKELRELEARRGLLEATRDRLRREAVAAAAPTRREVTQHVLKSASVLLSKHTWVVRGELVFEGPRYRVRLLEVEDSWEGESNLSEAARATAINKYVKLARAELTRYLEDLGKNDLAPEPGTPPVDFGPPTEDPAERQARELAAGPLDLREVAKALGRSGTVGGGPGR